MENQETTRKKKRFDMKRSFRRISAVIATMAFMTGLAACGSSQGAKGGSQSDSSASSTLIPHGWKKFTSKLMGYSVCFPGTPEKDTYKDNGGSYVRYSTVDKNDNINYAVSASQFSSKQTEESKEFSESQRRKVLSNYAHLMGVKEGEYTFTTVDGQRPSLIWAMPRRIPLSSCAEPWSSLRLDSMDWKLLAFPKRNTSSSSIPSSFPKIRKNERMASMIFATGSTYSQGTPAPDWMAPVMGVVIGREIN